MRMISPMSITGPHEGDYRQSPEPEWVSITEAAKILGVSVDSLRRWDVPGGKLRANRTPGGQRRYTRAQLRDAFGKTA